MKLKKPLIFMGEYYIKLPGGRFWHWLLWGNYNILMTN